jgi:hypothetical protein
MSVVFSIDILYLKNSSMHNLGNIKHDTFATKTTSLDEIRFFGRRKCTVFLLIWLGHVSHLACRCFYWCICIRRMYVCMHPFMYVKPQCPDMHIHTQDTRVSIRRNILTHKSDLLAKAREVYCNVHKRHAHTLHVE